MIQALNRPVICFLLLVMFFYQIAFGGYEQLFSLFTLTRLGMDATSTAGLFALAGRKNPGAIERGEGLNQT